MHRSYLVAAVFLIVAAPAWAQQQSGQPSSGKQSRQSVLGSHTCSDIVPCAGTSEAASVTADQWAQYGNSCMTSAFGSANPNGFIDDTAGLDSNGCMTAKNSSSQGAGSLAPRCCVVTLPSQECSVHCDLIK